MRTREELIVLLRRFFARDPVRYGDLRPGECRYCGLAAGTETDEHVGLKLNEFGGFMYHHRDCLYLETFLALEAEREGDQ